MRHLILIVIVFATSSSWAKFKNNPEMVKFHAINSKVAKILNPKNAQQIKKISSSLKSAKDRAHFEKLYVQKKASGVVLTPFMDRLVIKEGKKAHVMRLISLRPLTVKLDYHAPVKIDSSNILKSLSPQSSKRSALLELLLPSANAWGSDAGSDWAFMYSAVAESVAQETGFGGKTAIDQAAFGEEVAQFIQKFDIKNFNCNHGVQAHMYAGAQLFYGVSYTNSKGQRFAASCGDGASDCIAVPTSNSGSIDSVLIDYEKSEKAVRSAIARQAQITADSPDFSINDFESHCTMTSSLFSGEYPQCSLTPLVENKYSSDVIEKLKTTNLLSDEQYKDTNLTQHIEATMNFGQGLAQMELSKNEGFILSSLSACCKSTECSEQAKDKLPMSSDIPNGIGQ